jgi:hypothetical protein
VRGFLLTTVGVLLGGLVWLLAQQALEIDVVLAVDSEVFEEGGVDHIEVFISHHRQHYRPWNGVRTDLHDSAEHVHGWRLRSGLPIRHLRIDPGASAGEIALQAVRLSGPGGVIEYRGAALAEVLRLRQHLELTGVNPDRLQLRSTGDDPQLTLRVPASVQWPRWRDRLGSLLPTLLGSAALFWWLSSRSGRHTAGVSGQRIAAIALLAVALTPISNSLISEQVIKGDAAQNLLIARNLVTHGHYTLSQAPPLLATSVREPVVVASIAARLLTLDPESLAQPFPALQRGETARRIKQVNLPWVAIGLLGFGVLALQLTGRLWLALLSSLAVWQLFFRFHVDSLYTEFHAAVLMAWVSVSAIAALTSTGRRRQQLLWALTGVLLGLLALTKSLMLFAIPVFILLVAVVAKRPATSCRGRHPCTVTAPARPWRPALRGGLIMAVTATLVLSPWMLRNQLQLGSPSLSEGRSGWVVYKRALLNELSPAQQRGAYALYGPQMYRELVAGTRFGISPADFTQASGYLAPLHYTTSGFSTADWEARLAGRPEAAISLYQTTSATYMQALQAYREAGDPDPGLRADRSLTQRGVERIVADPVAHLRLTPLILWRGTWSMHQLEIPRPSPLPALPFNLASQVLNALGALALGGVFVFALLRRNAPLLAALSLPVLMMLGYALLSQGLPRFFLPATPFMLLALAVALFRTRQPDRRPTGSARTHPAQQR